jgi:alcohol dehydrogenase
MAWAAYASGVSLAHAGLGIVHGLASPIGSYYPIPHGVVCGTLLPAATEINVQWLIEHDPTGIALAKHAEVAKLFGHQGLNTIEAAQGLINSLQQLKTDLEIPQLADWSVGVEDRILDKAGLKNNPALLERHHIARLLLNAGAS